MTRKHSTLPALFIALVTLNFFLYFRPISLEVETFYAGNQMPCVIVIYWRIKGEYAVIACKNGYT